MTELSKIKNGLTVHYLMERMDIKKLAALDETFNRRKVERTRIRYSHDRGYLRIYV